LINGFNLGVNLRQKITKGLELEFEKPIFSPSTNIFQQSSPKARNLVQIQIGFNLQPQQPPS
jgi:hypothetical protein